MRCLALHKALCGPAYTWAQNTIADQIKAGNWPEVKKEILNRFAPPDKELKLRESLAKMKFNPSRETLLTFVEEFADKYRKVHPNNGVTALIGDLSLILPRNIVRHLNTISEKWLDLSDLALFYELIKRVEHCIIPYEDIPTTRLDTSEILQLFTDIKASLTGAKEAASPAKPPDEATVAIYAPETQSGNRSFNLNTGADRNGDTRQRQEPNNYQTRPYNQQRNQQNPHTTRFNPYQANYRTNQQPNPSTSQPNVGYNQQQNNYFRRFGRPPSECRYCGALHFNRHCPYITPDLK